MLLLGGLAVLTDERTIAYRGAEYVAGAVVEQAPGAEPTEDLVDGRQVWLPRGDAEYDLYLRLADGRFEGFRRRA